MHQFQIIREDGKPEAGPLQQIATPPVQQEQKEEAKEKGCEADTSLEAFLKQDHIGEMDKAALGLNADDLLEKEEEEEKGQETLKPAINPKDEELVAYIQELLEMINTDDEELNKNNMELLVDQIAQKLKDMSGRQQDKAQIRRFLEELKTQQLSQAKTEEERKVILAKMTESFYNIGYIGFYASSQSQCAAAAVQLGIQGGSLQTLSSGLVSNSAWIAMAFVYTAQTGLNYRRYKKGKIDKKEFWHRMKLNSVTTVGSMAVGSGGAAAGFAVGTLIFPGVGSIVGAVVGGLAGGFAGEKWSAKAYNMIEMKLEESKLKKEQEEKHTHFKELESSCQITHERYDEALHTLGLPSYRVNLS